MKTPDLVEFARKYYIGSRTELSFKRDLYLLKLIQKQLIRYEKKGLLNIKLLLNNIILFFNVFQTQQAKYIIFKSIEQKFHPILKTILLHLDLLTDEELESINIDVEISRLVKELLPY